MDGGATPMDEGRCWVMLAQASFGRVALTVGAMPVIVPVRYHVDGTALRVQLARVRTIDHAMPGSVVAFEADGFDVEAQRQWSVHAIGRVAPRDAAFPDGDRGLFELWPLIVQGYWLTFDQDFF